MEGTGLNLGDNVSAKVIKYDPTKDEELEFYVEILDGQHAGKKGWMIDSLSCHSEDDIPITQFAKAALPVLPQVAH
jgi:hypothetical protein